MKIEQVPYQLIHSNVINLDAHYAKIFRPFELIDSGATSLFIDNQLVAIFGFIESPGVTQAFVIPDALNFSKYRFSVLKLAKAYVAAFRLQLEHEYIHRVWCMSPDTWQVSDWLVTLGFESEGFHPKFSEDKIDYRSWRLA